MSIDTTGNLLFKATKEPGKTLLKEVRIMDKVVKY